MKKPSNKHTLFSRRSTPRRRERKRTALFDMSASFAASSSAGCLLLCLRTGFPWRRVPYCALFPRLLPVGAIIFPTKSTTDGANLTLQSSAALLMPAQVAQPPPPPPETRESRLRRASIVWRRPPPLSAASPGEVLLLRTPAHRQQHERL